LLNPHVYLDTVILIGSVGAQQSWPIWFAAGAASASMLWFFSLAIGGARLAPLLSRPVTWRVIDLLVAAMLLAVAWTLADPVRSWCALARIERPAWSVAVRNALIFQRINRRPSAPQPPQTTP